jgi:uncharacterized protein (TIGR02246 family)
MEKEKLSSSEGEVARVVRDVNRAWLDGDLAGLRWHFHKYVTFVAPNCVRVGSGIDACVRSYEDFSSQAEVTEFEIKNIQVDLFENTAVATSEYRIGYEMKGEKQREEGSEILVLSRDSGRWLVVWRMILAPGSG